MHCQRKITNILQTHYKRTCTASATLQAHCKHITNAYALQAQHYKHITYIL